MTQKNSLIDEDKPLPIKFQTEILKTGKTTTGIEVPPEVVEALGSGKQPLVKVRVNDYAYRSSIGTMDGKSMVSFSSAHRKASGLQGGDTVTVTLEVDLEPRAVEIPEDLKAALVNARALEAFEKSAPSMKKEYVRQVETAKAQETRARRIAKIVAKLSEG